MTVTVPAVYENGVLRLLRPVDLPEHAEVEVTIAPVEESAQTTTSRRFRYPTRSRPLGTLGAVSGVVSLGGDALKDSEALYDVSG
jgi:predicted DNA-binding antitoxin AbrB/MazE fold protein